MAFNINHNHPQLDDGEKDLMIFAESLTKPAWLINGPDMAAVRFAHSVGWIDRLVSIEALTRHLRLRLQENLNENYTERWLAQRRTNLLLGDV